MRDRNRCQHQVPNINNTLMLGDFQKVGISTKMVGKGRIYEGFLGPGGLLESTAFYWETRGLADTSKSQIYLKRYCKNAGKIFLVVKCILWVVNSGEYEETVFFRFISG